MGKFAWLILYSLCVGVNTSPLCFKSIFDTQMSADSAYRLILGKIAKRVLSLTVALQEDSYFNN